MSDDSNGNTPEFTLVRVLDAPRPLVWRAWTDPSVLATWHHPRDIEILRDTIETDVRVGGRYRYTLVNPATGEAFPTGGTYLEVVEPERLVFTWGNPSDPVDGAPRVTLVFVDRAPQTEMIFHLRGVAGFAGDNYVHDGWSEALDNLRSRLAQPVGASE
jgi:uncharacterized protein YndB with AHSA1/START domain